VTNYPINQNIVSGYTDGRQCIYLPAGTRLAPFPRSFPSIIICGRLMCSKRGMRVSRYAVDNLKRSFQVIAFVLRLRENPSLRLQPFKCLGQKVYNICQRICNRFCCTTWDSFVFLRWPKRSFFYYVSSKVDMVYTKYFIQGMHGKGTVPI